MKKFAFICALATACSAGSAMGADLPARAPVYKAAPPVYGFSWTGCYIGGHVGGLWAKKDWTLAPPDAITPLGSNSVDGWIGGAQTGCDYQFAGGFVIGIQGDHSWMNAFGSHVDAIVDGTDNETNIRGLSTVTARIGYAWDRFLGYVKAGGAWERDNYTRYIAGTAIIDGSASETRSGWTVGVGGEYAFTNYLSAFAEYNYFNFGDRTVTFLTPAGAFNDNITIHERKSVARIGLNLRWGAAPVVAKY